MQTLNRFIPYYIFVFAVLGTLLCLAACAEQGAEELNTALIAAIENGQTSTVRQLLDQGADVESLVDGITPLSHAAHSGCLAVVRLLLERGADANKEPGKVQEGDSALLWSVGDWRRSNVKDARSASYRERMEIVKLLFDRTHMDAARLDTLVAACIFRRYDVVKFLLDRGVSVEGQARQSGYSPLVAAAASGDVRCMKLLVQQGADVNRSAIKEYTPLMMAAYEAHLAAVKYLLSQHADVHRKDKNGDTALNWARNEGSGQSKPDDRRAVIRLLQQSSGKE